MAFLCKLVGHKPPVYAEEGWFSPGEEYASSLIPAGVDGIRRGHIKVEARCARCDTPFVVVRIHVSEEEHDKIHRSYLEHKAWIKRCQEYDKRLSSSVVEQGPLNSRVAGSNPA